MKTNKSTKIFAMLIALTAIIVTGCANGSAESGSGNTVVRNYKVECGQMPKTYYITFISEHANDELTFQSIRNTRDDFKINHTNENTYVAQATYSYAALRALLRRDLMPGLSSDDAIEACDFLGNYITFIDVTENQLQDWVTWVYFER